jgi:putative MATE family efflux protein
MGELESKDIRRKIFSMILPIMIENILEMAAGMISLAMIGRISALAIDSFGIGNRIVQIIWALFKGITTGATVFVAQAYGAGDFKRLRQIILQALASGIVLLIVFQQIIFWKASSILMIFNPAHDLLLQGTLYLRIASWGLPFLGLMLLTIGVLQGMGNAKTPMYIALFMNLMNVIISYPMIFGKFGFTVMGLKGAAIATVIAQFLGAAAGIYILFHPKGELSLLKYAKNFKLNFKEIRNIYKVGLPTSFEFIFWQVAAIILTRAILSYGEISFAAYQLGLQAESISYMPAAGFGIAATAFVGQSIGAQNGQMGKRYLKEILKESLILTICTACLLIFCPGVIMRLLTNDKQVIDLGMKYLIIMGFVQVPQNMSNALNGALRGAGYTKVSMLVAGIGLWGIRIPSSLLLAYVFKSSIIVIWMMMGVDLIVRFMLSFFLYKSKDIYHSKRVLEG